MGATKRLFEEQRERERAFQSADDYDYQYEQYINQNNTMNKTDKEAILKTLHNLNLDLINGHISPLESYQALREISDTAKDLMDAWKEQAIEELAKLPDKKLVTDDYVITIQNSAGRWDFKHLSEWNKQKDILAQLEEQYKDALKMFDKGRTLIDSEGEITPMAHYKSGGETLIFKKKINSNNINQ